MLRALFALSMFAYPAEFRREYRSQLVIDFEDRRADRAHLLRLFFDVLLGGIAMRIESLWRDAAYAVRALLKAPVFTSIVTGTVAIAIAANAIVFAALYAVVIAPFPFAHMDRLAVIDGRMHIGAAPGMVVPIPLDFSQKQLRTSPLVESVAGSGISLVHARVDGRYAALREGMVTASYFGTLGVAPFLGGFFDGTRRDETRIILSYEYWKTHYNGDPSVLGKITVIDGRAFTISGIAPADMFDPATRTRRSADVYTIFPRETGDTLYNTVAIVRMRPGVTVDQLQADAQRIWRLSGIKNPFQNPRFLKLQVHALRDVILGDRTRSLWILFGAVAAVLLIACANIANLLLARGVSRTGEFAVRSALGAARSKMASQLVMETLVLCIAGCALGLLLTALFMRPALALIPGDLPRLQNAHIDTALLLYICGLCVLVTVVAGVFPAFRTANFSRRPARSRVALVAAEIGIAFALLVCSGLLLRSFIALISQDVGFDPRNLYVASFLVQSAGGAAYEVQPRDATIITRIAQQIRALPGVGGVALGTQTPFDNGPNMMIGDIWIQGQPRPTPGRFSSANITTAALISPEYVPLMHIPVLAGRAFTHADLAGRGPVLVNETFAREFLHGKSTVGKRIEGVGGSAPIVGVIGDVRTSLTEDPRPEVYMVLHQTPDFQILMRTTHDDPQLAGQIAAIAKKLDPRIGTPPVVSMNDAIRANAASAHAAAVLLGALALIALLLALAGIYGIVSFSVERRYHEIGVRLALGATNGDIFRRTVMAALAQSFAGIAFGIVAAAIAANMIQTQLFNVVPLDPLTFVGTVALLLACTVLAAAIPAWRAMRVDPVKTLRYE